MTPTKGLVAAGEPPVGAAVGAVAGAEVGVPGWLVAGGLEVTGGAFELGLWVVVLEKRRLTDSGVNTYMH